MAGRTGWRISLLALCLAAGCGGSDGQHQCNDSGANSLGGSYCEDVDMSFAEVKLLTVSQVLRIEYVRPLGTGEEKLLQIIIGSSMVTLEPNVEIKLLDAGAQVRRIVAAGQQNLTPELDAKSSITFSDYTGTIGSHLSGKFAILFKTSGRTLQGNFDGTIIDAKPMM